jgi:hypothetical protein
MPQEEEKKEEEEEDNDDDSDCDIEKEGRSTATSLWRQRLNDRESPEPSFPSRFSPRN